MAYNSDRKGYETKDGGLIRINGDDKVRIDIYEGNEREKGDYDFAYNRYKNSVLILEEQFARPALEQRLVKVLKLSR